MTRALRLALRDKRPPGVHGAQTNLNELPPDNTTPNCRGARGVPPDTNIKRTLLQHLPLDRGGYHTNHAPRQPRATVDEALASEG